MKLKIKHILSVIIISFALTMTFISCSHQTCPTYEGRESSGKFSNGKPIR